MGDATTVDMKAWERDIRINLTSMVLMCRFAIPEMRKARRGAIVNLSSVSGSKLKSFPFSYRAGFSKLTYSVLMAVMGGNPSLLYATTKGAIIQMTRAMASHYGRDQIRVNCVAPGMVYTPMVRGRGMSEEMRQSRINQNLLKTEGTAWDVGYGKNIYLWAIVLHVSCVENAHYYVTAILFLSSKEARWITGLIMPVDAGVSITVPHGPGNRPSLYPGSRVEYQTTAAIVGRPALLADTLADKKDSDARGSSKL